MEILFIILNTVLTNAISIRANFKAIITLALIRPHGIEAGSIVADVRGPYTLIKVNTRGAVSRENIAWVTDALKAALEVVAHTMLAHSSLLTLIDICTHECPMFIPKTLLIPNRQASACCDMQDTHNLGNIYNGTQHKTFDIYKTVGQYEATRIKELYSPTQSFVSLFIL